MAKISPTSIKYNILAEFKSEGPLEKPDVIGAIFGQTEGLLGSEMELRELQKEGKVGRIEVELETEEGKTKGEIVIPSAMNKTETTIIAAALETIDKIGPTSTKINVNEIEDVRGSKRDYIMERAKQLLSGIRDENMDSTEIENTLRESTRISKVKEYGSERLPAGDLSGQEVIVVEGRADVVNLLRHGIKNVIGMNGTRLPKEISKLGKEKELTLFVDGDRGGKLITKNVCEYADIAYVATAPDGKEVEELTGKEIHQALRKKQPVEKAGIQEKKEDKQELTKEDRQTIRNLAEKVKKRNVILLDDNLEEIKDIPLSKLGHTKQEAFVLMTDTATKRIVENAEKLNTSYIAARNFGSLPETDIEFVSI
ncbi:MAG: DNA primase DnaG [Candidatus Nanoarchaeia archaeon]